MTSYQALGGNRTKNAFSILMLALLLANLVLLFWYLFIGYKGYFHSDSAAKVLLAREVFDTGSYFPREWNHVNSDLFVIFGHIFIIPLLAIMPAGFTAHAISGAIVSCLILHGIWLLTGLAHLPVWRRLAAVAVVASGISGFVAENLYGQVSYGVVLLLCIYHIFLATKIAFRHNESNVKWIILFLILISLVYWANPARALVTYSLPLIATLTYLFLAYQGQHRNSLLKTAGLVLAGAVVGGILHFITIANVNNVHGASNAQWLPFDLILRNITLTLKGIYAQLGGLPLAGASIFSLEGLYAGMRFIVASMAIVLITIAIKRTIEKTEKELQFLALFTAFSLLIVLLLQITTSIPDMSDPVQSSRYLVPGVMLGLVILLLSELDWTRSPLFTITLSIVFLAFASSGYSTYLLTGVNSEQILSQPGQVNPHRPRLVDFLDEKDLHYGYAGYWNAGAFSVLSNERTKIRQIQWHKGIPIPMKHLSSNRWYRPATWKGRTFILLQKGEADKVDWELLRKLGATPIERYQFDDFLIYVFPDNIAKHIPGWDMRYETPTNFFPLKNVLKKTGRLEKSDSGLGYILIADEDESGALHYGPFVHIEPGKYRATFDLSANRHPDGAVRIDVAKVHDQKILEELSLNESDKPQEIVFNVEKPTVLAFRVWALGNVQVTFRGYTVQRASD